MNAVNLETLDITITPPVYGSQCVLSYTITSTGSDGTTRDITVEVIDTEATVTRTESDFNLCNNTYNFTIVANTSSGPGGKSDVIIAEKVDFLSEY